INDAVVPEEELEVFMFLLVIHVVKSFEVHGISFSIRRVKGSLKLSSGDPSLPDPICILVRPPVAVLLNDTCEKRPVLSDDSRLSGELLPGSYGPRADPPEVSGSLLRPEGGVGIIPCRHADTLKGEDAKIVEDMVQIRNNLFTA